MSNTRRGIVIAVMAVLVVVTGAVVGRHLTGRSTNKNAASVSAPKSSSAHNGLTAPLASPSGGSIGAVPSNRAAASDSGAASSGAATSQSPADGGALPSVPVFALTPQIVRTATIDLRVGKDSLNPTLTRIAGLASDDGGYVESSSVAGGTARSTPDSGSIVIHVLDSDFSQAMSALAGYGKVTDQQFQGKDVTNQVSENAATIQVLQEEVNLLQGKLAQATDINTFLDIQEQLFPAEQQLQQLENQQSVLENSAAFATITADLSAPGVPVLPAPQPRPNANAATVAWRYLRHNSLAVLDGLVVGGSWALPVVALLALVWLAGTRIVRRRGHAVTPA